MTTDINELVKRLRDGWSGSLRHAAADALEAMAGERDRTRDDYEAMKAHNKELFGKLSAAELERDRLKDRLDCIDRDVAIGIGTVEAVKRLTAERDRLAGEVEQANVKATSMQRWIDHHNERADKAEAQVEALRGENARLAAQVEALTKGGMIAAAGDGT